MMTSHSDERLAEARALLAHLCEMEALYRYNHDHIGADHISTGRSWDHLKRAGDEARAFLAHDDTPAPTGRGYIPTDVYTSLPQKAKDYIMELETRCDPAGDIAELANRRDQVKQLEALVETARSTLQDVMDAVAWSGWAIDDPRWKVPMRAAHAFLDRKGPDTPAPVEPGEGHIPGLRRDYD